MSAVLVQKRKIDRQNCFYRQMWWCRVCPRKKRILLYVSHNIIIIVINFLYIFTNCFSITETTSESISLELCNKVTDDGMAIFSQVVCPSITQLNLWGCTRLTLLFGFDIRKYLHLIASTCFSHTSPFSSSLTELLSNNYNNDNHSSHI